jgi:hypothetical protein
MSGHIIAAFAMAAAARSSGTRSLGYSQLKALAAWGDRRATSWLRGRRLLKEAFFPL